MRSSHWKIWVFHEPLHLAAASPCALRQSTEAFGRISSLFLREMWTRIQRSILPAHFALEKLDIISTSSSYGGLDWVVKGISAALTPLSRKALRRENRTSHQTYEKQIGKRRSNEEKHCRPLREILQKSIFKQERRKKRRERQ